MSHSRSRFLALTAGALPMLAGCGGGGSTTYLPGLGGPSLPSVPAAPFLAAGTVVNDLRYGKSPTPPTFAGYSPAGDAAALIVAGTPSPAANAVPGTVATVLRYAKSPPPPPFAGYSPAGDAAALIVAGTPSPAANAVPGTLATGSYATNQRYVIKVPTAWNGRLIVAGTPSFRSEFANDAIWGDFALAQGYAFASSNKGVLFNAIVESAAATTSPTTFFPIPFDLASLETKNLGFRFGSLTQSPTPQINTWNLDFATLTVAAQTFLANYFGKAPT